MGPEGGWLTMEEEKLELALNELSKEIQEVTVELDRARTGGFEEFWPTEEELKLEQKIEDLKTPELKEAEEKLSKLRSERESKGKKASVKQYQKMDVLLMERNRLMHRLMQLKEELSARTARKKVLGK